MHIYQAFHHSIFKCYYITIHRCIYKTKRWGYWLFYTKAACAIWQQWADAGILESPPTGRSDQSGLICWQVKINNREINLMRGNCLAYLKKTTQAITHIFTEDTAIVGPSTTNSQKRSSEGRKVKLKERQECREVGHMMMFAAWRTTWTSQSVWWLT